jgi:hypothetical protein
VGRHPRGWCLGRIIGVRSGKFRVADEGKLVKKLLLLLIVLAIGAAIAYKVREA